jgi:4-amino-4-deoxy-L-arabinose transferase-like glycosyltransferase
MATRAEALRPASPAESVARARLPRWSIEARAAIVATTAFIAITLWWLTQDRSIPIYDAGLHLTRAIDIHQELSTGHLLNAAADSLPYPPLVYLIGSLGIALGGVDVAPPIIAQNLIFVPLLALGCYQLGRLAFNPLAGLLAVLFALGSPLLIVQFHVFMVDAPFSAMVAVSVWLIVLSDRFSRVGISALAGLAVGLGMLTKEPFVFYVAGVVAVALLRGGWRSWRGLLAFAIVTLVVCAPWYIQEYPHIHTIGAGSLAEANHPAALNDIAPARFSLDNLEWYFWNILNHQLYLPLFAFAVVGWLWMVGGALRRRLVSPLVPELLVGAFVAWFGITETFVHDTRYSEPLLAYLAVIATGWVVRLPRVLRTAAVGAIVTIALANTLANSFGVGGQVNFTLPGSDNVSLQQPNHVAVFSNGGFLVAQPKRDGDLIAVLRGLRHQGITGVLWQQQQALNPDFSTAGVSVLVQIAGLQRIPPIPLDELSAQDVILAHEAIDPNGPPPCVALDDHTGVWMRIGNPVARGARDYCPLPTPHHYGPAQP